MAGLVLQILVEIAATHHAGEIRQRVGEQGMADLMGYIAILASQTVVVIDYYYPRPLPK